jgi:hypothetical protein
MTARRLSVATAVLALAVLGLTACGPEEAKPATGPSLTAGATATPTAGATPTASAKPSAPAASKSAPKASATPAANCTANAAGIGRVIQITEVGYSTSVWIKAKETRFVCGHENDGDGYFEPVGEVKLFGLTNEAAATVFAEMKPKSVPLTDFMKHADDCLRNRDAVRPPYSCYGSKFAVTVDAAGGKINKIDELFHA